MERKSHKPEDLSFWITKALKLLNCPQDHAELIASELILTSLWGIDSHGVERIFHYLKRLENGTINSNPNFEFKKNAKAVGILNADDAHGIVSMNKAVNWGLQLAEEFGISSVGVHRSTHCGAIGLYTRKIARKGMIGIAFTHSDSLVVPTYGSQKFFGTNPISISIPRKNNDICLDMATSIKPWNYVINSRQNDQTLEENIAVNSKGEITTNPFEADALLPFGDYKGFGLGMMIDILCGPLNGMKYGPKLSSMHFDLDKKRNLGSTIIVINPKAFNGSEYFTEIINDMILDLKDANPKTYLPGEKENISYQKRLKQGIPISEDFQKNFELWSIKLNI